MRLTARFLPICAALVALAAPVRAADPDAPLDLKPTGTVDERVFILNAADHLLNTWSPGTTDRAAVRAWLDGRAALLARMTARAKAADLDKELVALLDEMRKLTDRHETFLANAGLIDQRAANWQAADNFATGYNAGKTAADVYERARASGADRGDAAAASVIIAGIGALLEANEREDKRNAARDAAVRAEQRELQTAFETALARGREAARVLGTRYEWTEGRAGLDGFKAEKMDEYIRRRPQDPFLRLRNANIRVPNETGADLLTDARACVAAARLIPSDQAYDVFRAWCLESASELAAAGAGREWFADPAHKYPTASAAEAVRIARTRMRYPDPTDAGKYELARALNFAGRPADALRTASDAKKQFGKPGFAYDYACLLSLNGDTKLSLEWLTHAFKLGHTDVIWTRRDPDLAALRRDKGTEFDKLTTATATWKIEFGLFNDDIVVTNTSAFPLTDVRLTPKIVRNGQTYTKTLRVAYLAPGRSYTWEDVFSIPGSTADSSSATLECDQNK
jgi:hypothetical protein